MRDRDSFDDFTKLRLRKADQFEPGREPTACGMPAFVGQVLSPPSKIAVGKFLEVRPMTILGTETEGASGSLSSVTSGRVTVYLVGPGIPATGESLICRFVDHRWAAERSSRGGGQGEIGTLPSCFCNTIPATLAMVSADPNCNYRMFQSCTIRYGPTPSQYAELALGARSFLSVEDFPDPVANNARFRYFLTCQFNQFSLTRIYADSPYGTPYRDGVLYTWLIGGQGNTCSPFRLASGQAFPGSDNTCRVSMS